jgi:hypothetical protein
MTTSVEKRAALRAGREGRVVAETRTDCSPLAFSSRREEGIHARSAAVPAVQGRADVASVEPTWNHGDGTWRRQEQEQQAALVGCIHARGSSSSSSSSTRGSSSITPRQQQQQQEQQAAPVGCIRTARTFVGGRWSDGEAGMFDAAEAERVGLDSKRELESGQLDNVDLPGRMVRAVRWEPRGEEEVAKG